MTQPRCPHCDTPVSRADAIPAGKTRPEQTREDLYTCPHCRGAIRVVVPVFKTSPAGWHWHARPSAQSRAPGTVSR